MCYCRLKSIESLRCNMVNLFITIVPHLPISISRKMLFADLTVYICVEYEIIYSLISELSTLNDL